MKKAIVASSIVTIAVLAIMASPDTVSSPSVTQEMTTVAAATSIPATTYCSTTSVETIENINTTTSITTETAISEITTEINTSISEECSEIEESYPIVEETIEYAEPIITAEYVVYKPSTKYVHRSICRWNCGDAMEIDNTNDIEARLCDECNPDIVIVNQYIEPEPEINTVYSSLSSYDIELLRQIVEYEAGSSWISTYEKARVAAGVMSRVNDSRFPNSVYGVLTQSGQFPGFYPDTISYSQGAIDAVDYYLNNPNNFGNENSWYGDGYQNYFYYQ